ncbi:helix-turn-helix domain-containing protein [Pannus brasiliensis CCIBt3594]|uniref:Helix-turn-helix domain-containing protein n=1 Tax=Pannus brasiliensis CCIBt3594 TaxID=1427578 RepID=A0AAW9QIQ1_9CHRO
MMDASLQRVLEKQRRRIEFNNSRLRRARERGAECKVRGRELRFGGEENAVARQRIRQMLDQGWTYREVASWWDTQPSTIERIYKRVGQYKKL